MKIQIGNVDIFITLEVSSRYAREEDPKELRDALYQDTLDFMEHLSQACTKRRAKLNRRFYLKFEKELMNREAAS